MTSGMQVKNQNLQSKLPQRQEKEQELMIQEHNDSVSDSSNFSVVSTGIKKLASNGKPPELNGPTKTKSFIANAGR
jgi:hypothetical protein